MKSKLTFLAFFMENCSIYYKVSVRVKKKIKNDACALITFNQNHFPSFLQ